MKPSYVIYHEEQLDKRKTICEKLDYIRKASHDVGIKCAWTRESSSEEYYLKELEKQLYAEYKIYHIIEEINDMINYVSKYNIKINIDKLDTSIKTLNKYYSIIE